MNTPKSRQERAQDTRDRIIRGAALAFATKGYAASSIADILEKAEVTKGALYFHFDTKDQVADAIVTAHVEWIREITNRNQVSEPQGLIDLVYVLSDALFKDVIAQAAVRLALDRGTESETSAPVFEAWDGLAASSLMVLQEQRQLKAGNDVDELVRLFTSGLFGLHMVSQSNANAVPLHTDIASFWRFILPRILHEEALEGLDYDHPDSKRDTPNISGSQGAAGVEGAEGDEEIESGAAEYSARV